MRHASASAITSSTVGLHPDIQMNQIEHVEIHPHTLCDDKVINDIDQLKNRQALRKVHGGCVE